VFTVMIQLGSILAIVWLYRDKVFRTVAGLSSDPEARRFAWMVILATVPALVAGALFSKFVKSVLYDTPAVIAAAFIAGGIVMLLVERHRPAPMIFAADHTPMHRALAIGACQTVALIPGVSRSGATIVGGLLNRLDRPAAAEFSFFLAMPTMAAAFAHDAWEVRDHLASERAIEIAIGFTMAFISALLVVKPFLRFVSRSGFAPFAWYRIAMGLAILMLMGAGIL